jgi:hypothetical protein
MRESNSQSRLAKPMLSHLTNPPNLVLTRRIELLSIGYQPIALPLSYMRIKNIILWWSVCSDYSLEELLAPGSSREYSKAHWGCYKQQRSFSRGLGRGGIPMFHQYALLYRVLPLCRWGLCPIQLSYSQSYRLWFYATVRPFGYYSGPRYSLPSHCTAYLSLSLFSILASSTKFLT